MMLNILKYKNFIKTNNTEINKKGFSKKRDFRQGKQPTSHTILNIFIYPTLQTTFTQVRHSTPKKL